MDFYSWESEREATKDEVEGGKAEGEVAAFRNVLGIKVLMLVEKRGD